MSAYLQSLGDYPGTVIFCVAMIWVFLIMIIHVYRTAPVRCARKREPVYTDPYSPHLLPRPSVDREIKAAFDVKAKPELPVLPALLDSEGMEAVVSPLHVSVRPLTDCQIDSLIATVRELHTPDKPKGHIKKSLGKVKSAKSAKGKLLKEKAKRAMNARTVKTSRHTSHSPSCSSKQQASRHPKKAR